jgi:hypothetical protein
MVEIPTNKVKEEFSTLQTKFIKMRKIINNWVMHPVVRVSINSVRNTVFFSARFYCALLTLHVSAPFGGHLQVVHKHSI